MSELFHIDPRGTQMPTTKLRTMLTAFAAAAVLSAVGAGSASALSIRAIDDLPTTTQIIKPTRVMEVEAFPTGDGPADDEVCNLFAFRMDQILGDMKRDMLSGDGDGAVANAEALDNVENMATDAGCAVIY
jgi:hypothetical protein